MKTFNISKNIWYKVTVALGVVLLLVLCLYDLNQYHIIHVLYDEFGYWSSAAFFSGKDWSEVTSHIMYYSYGYGFFLAILMKFFHSGTSLYQSAIVMNALFLVVSYFLAINFVQKMFPKLNRYSSVIFAFISVCYGSNIVNARVVWPEVLLTMYFWILCNLLFSLVLKPTHFKVLMTSLVTMLMYCTHQRSLGILVSLLVILIILAIRKLISPNMLFVFAYFTAILSVLQIVIKNILTSKLWLRGDVNLAFLPKAVLFLLAGLIIWICICYLFKFLKAKHITLPFHPKYIFLALLVLGLATIILFLIRIISQLDNAAVTTFETNDYSGVLAIFKSALQQENGLYGLLQGFMGKIYYVAAATGLVAIWGFVLSIRQSFTLIKPHINGKRKLVAKKYSGSYISLFLVLSFLSTLAINTIFMSSGHRQDCIIYGRYTEPVIGPLIVLGLVTLFYTRKKILPAVSTLVLMAPTIYLTWQAFDINPSTSFNYISNIAVSTHFTDGEYNTNIITNLGYISIGMFLLLFALSYIPLKKWWKVLYSGILTVAFCYIMWNPNMKYMYDSLRNAHSNLYQQYNSLAEYIQEAPEIEELYYIAYNDNFSSRSIEYLQFLLPDLKIHYLMGTDETIYNTLMENQNAWLITQLDYADYPKLFEHYYWLDDSPTWKLFIPMTCDAVNILKGKGHTFRNDSNGLIISQEMSYSQNAEASYTGFWQSNGDPGYLAYGQYITLPPGNYVYTADLTTVSIIGMEAHIDMAIKGEIIDEYYPNLSEYLDPDMHIHCEIPFHLDDWTSYLEFRVYSSLGIKIQIDSLRVKRVD